MSRKVRVAITSLLMFLAGSSSPASAQVEGAFLTSLAGNIGPLYDPLFYDVMVYIFGVMVFAMFLLSVISYWIRRKGLGGTSQEKWVAELEKYYEREGLGLLPRI